MKSISQILLLSIPLLFFSQQILALKCGYKIVDIGDRKSKIYRRCGEPEYVETYQRNFPLNCVVNDYGYDNGYYKRGLPYYSVCRTVTIDIWTYNFGRHKFMRELIFHDGILKDINLLEYGD